MTNKIQELTEKIYKEGIEKAEAEAKSIIENAKKEADQIMAEARKREREIIEKAKYSAVENKKNVDAELKLAAAQFTSNLKQYITNCITTTQIDTSLKNSFSDTEFVKKVISTVVQNWNSQTEEPDLKILLPENTQKEFTNFLEDKTHKILDKGVSLEFDPKTKSGFKIGPQNGTYIISFEKNDFENFFKKYFRESTRKMLFD